MNNQQPQQPTYQRKVGLFGSIKKLGVTTVAGANNIVVDAIGVATDVTGSARVGTSLLRTASTLWGNDLIADLENDARVNALHREIELEQQKAELDNLKAVLARAKATNA